jgi:hypothetical protein
MKMKLIAVASAAMFALAAVASPNQAEARWRGHVATHMVRDHIMVATPMAGPTRTSMAA